MAEPLLKPPRWPSMAKQHSGWGRGALPSLTAAAAPGLYCQL